MAALHEIARQYADEIRDGIAWVIIWKTGRSWHAESVWLNPDSDTFELDDLSTATEILEHLKRYPFSTCFHKKVLDLLHDLSTAAV